MESLGDWSSLSSDLLVKIAACVELFEDFMAFRGVCTSWRVAGSTNKFKTSRHTVPLLMLPNKGNDEHEFYSLSRRTICMRLPLGPLPETTGKRCIGVRFGWILVVGSSKDVNLLNPFSRAHIKLPNLRSSHIHESPFFNAVKFLNRADLSADPSESSNFVLMVIFGGWNLGFWRAGDKCWTDINLPDASFDDITYHNEKFYAFGRRSGAIAVCDPFGPDPTMADMFGVCIPYGYGCLVDAYLVESTNGELLIITVQDDRGNIVVRVMRVNTMTRLGERIAGLGNDAVFLSKVNASISVAFPDFVKPNCIYFTESDYSCWVGGIAPDLDGEENDIGIYNLKDWSIIEWLPFSHESLYYRFPPVWVAPSF